MAGGNATEEAQTKAGAWRWQGQQGEKSEVRCCVVFSFTLEPLVDLVCCVALQRFVASFFFIDETGEPCPSLISRTLQSAENPLSPVEPHRSKIA